MDMTSFFSTEDGPIWIKFRILVQTDIHVDCDCDDVLEIETRCRIPIWRTFGRIQWHIIPEPPATLQGAATWQIKCHYSELRVTLQGAVTIPEPHATLQGAVTWRNQCHDRATLQGVRIQSAILKIVFRHILFFLFLMQLYFD